MIEQGKVIDLVNSRIGGTELFLVDVRTGHSGDIHVHVDSMEGVTIEECVELSRWLTTELDLLAENYSLEVSSPGLGSPFVVMQQYEKNIGRDVEVVFKDGKKKKGVLQEVSSGTITLEYKEKMLAGGSQKKKKDVLVSKQFSFEDIKSTKVVITF